MDGCERDCFTLLTHQVSLYMMNLEPRPTEQTMAMSTMFVRNFPVIRVLELYHKYNIDVYTPLTQALV
jgi:hypothetical protein